MAPDRQTLDQEVALGVGDGGRGALVDDDLDAGLRHAVTAAAHLAEERLRQVGERQRLRARDHRRGHAREQDQMANRAAHEQPVHITIACVMACVAA